MTSIKALKFAIGFTKFELTTIGPSRPTSMRPPTFRASKRLCICLASHHEANIRRHVTPRTRLGRWAAQLCHGKAPGQPARRPFCQSAVSRTALEPAQEPLADNGSNSTIPNYLAKVEALPPNCPGCGAASQTTAPSDAGFYTLTRAGLRKYIRDASEKAEMPPHSSDPVCDRCHNLLHHSTGEPIYHPSVEAINQIISESPHAHNTIYHVLDALDLPMSLIPSLQTDLRLPRLRTQNRRSKHALYSRGRIAEVSFIVTRADLLAPNKEQVDRLLPYIRELLRDALGRSGKNVRMGNVRCVSAKRGWWTKAVKEEIWSRGGAGWMVGKVNVGKSSLFESVFPKGRISGPPRAPPDSKLSGLNALMDAADPHSSTEPEDLDFTTSSDLLPPARPASQYPVMPLSSPLPGTTASPIRIPYSNKGELIDLPGIARSSLPDHVQPRSHPSLVMHSRISPVQHVLKPGRSLLLGGGLIRLTNPSPSDILLVYPFVPIPIHVTSTDKALALECGELELDIDSLVTREAKSKMGKATTARLRWDVTKKRAGPLTRRDAVGLKPERLPFVVWSADVVVEGVGWVEVVAQRRRREWEIMKREEEAAAAAAAQKRQGELDPGDPFGQGEDAADGLEVAERQQRKSLYPEIEVYSPEGKFVATRPPMGAWLLSQEVKKKVAPGSRQRRSMRSVRLSEKARENQKAAAAGAL